MYSELYRTDFFSILDINGNNKSMKQPLVVILTIFKIIYLKIVRSFDVLSYLFHTYIKD